MAPKKICIWFNCCPMKRFYEQGRLEKYWIDNYCKGDFNKCIRKKKEENGEYHPDNMLPNGELRDNLV